MAVTITLAQLSNAMRVGQSTLEQEQVTRLLAYASDAVILHAPGADDTAHNEAVVRLAGYLFDQPPVTRGEGYSNALRSSGAARMLLPYRIHRAGSTSEAVAAAQQAVGTVGNPVINVTISGETLTIHYADSTTSDIALPAVHGGSTADTADLLVERLGTLENPTLPANRVWVGTGITIPDSVHVLMVDAGQVSDDYHLVDWDAVRMHPHAVAGTASTAVEFETFEGDAFHVLRIGHDGNEQLLIANEGTDAINLQHIHVERLLAPVAVNIGGGVFSGVDQTARDAAEAAQTSATAAAESAGVGRLQAAAAQATADAAQGEIDSHELNHPSGGSVDATARASAAAAQTTADAAQTDITDHETSHPTGADVEGRVAALEAAPSSATTYANVGVGTLNTARTSFGFSTAERAAVVAAWASVKALVLWFKNTTTAGTITYRVTRIPILEQLVPTGSQHEFHFDYGSHLTVDDHDCRLLIVPNGPTVSVQLLASGQSFPSGETLTVYTET